MLKNKPSDDPATELQAIETLWKLQREYRKSRDGTCAFRSIRICRKYKFPFPAWVTAFIDTAADEVLASNGDAGKIVAAVRLGPHPPDNDERRIVHALGFIPGDFEAVTADAWMFERADELRKLAK